MIKFIKIAPYDTGKLRSDSFEYAQALLSQTINPPAIEIGSLILPEADIIFCSPLKRAQQSAAKSLSPEIVTIDQLAEIRFDISMFTNSDQYQKFGSSVIRQAFVKAFIKNGLEQPLQDLESETEHLLDLLNMNNQNVIAISHSFRMKVIEAYILSNKQLFREPTLIKNFINTDTKLYEFKTGFSLVYN